LFLIAGFEVRVHWSLALVALLMAAQVVLAGMPWWLFPVLVAVWIVAVLLHELGHAAMTRLLGGHANRLVLWALGGITDNDVPPTPGKRFAVAAAGPLVSFVLYASAALAAHALGGGMTAQLLGLVADFNATLLLFNLIPAYPLDGGAMVRAALWPVVGLRRAVRWTITLAYVVLAGLAVWAVLTSSVLLFAIAAMLLISVIREHRAVADGFDPYLGFAEGYDPAGRPLLDTWRERREERRRAQVERDAAAEQEILDRLLAKVSDQGLHSLTQDERANLHRISKRQRERNGTAS
jgi:Zn-dependent protease